MTPKYDLLAVSLLRPNSWNPNVMSTEDYAKAIESIRRFGFIDPVTVRQTQDRYEIIDGENRWRAAKDLGLGEIPVIIVQVTDEQAQQLTIVLNELRGRPDAAKLQALIAELGKRRPLEDLAAVLPFRREQLATMVAARREEVDWEALAAPPPVPVVGVSSRERWVERVFRLPASAAAVLDDAIARASADEPIEPWRALELIAADFLGGN